MPSLPVPQPTQPFSIVSKHWISLGHLDIPNLLEPASMLTSNSKVPLTTPRIRTKHHKLILDLDRLKEVSRGSLVARVRRDMEGNAVAAWVRARRKRLVRKASWQDEDVAQAGLEDDATVGLVVSGAEADGCAGARDDDHCFVSRGVVVRGLCRGVAR
jgi:hypothetical protein